jgi:hypothetical protein
MKIPGVDGFGAGDFLSREVGCPEGSPFSFTPGFRRMTEMANVENRLNGINIDDSPDDS